MTQSRCILLTVFTLTFSSLAPARRAQHAAAKVDFEVAGAPLAGDAVDPQIKAALKLVSAAGELFEPVDHFFFGH